MRILVGMPGLRALEAVLDGDLLMPGSREYDAARRPALARFDHVRPLGVARCASVRDVARTLKFARDTNTLVVPRGGGHCFAGRSTTTGVVLDLSALDAIVMQPNGVARIGAGARLTRVNDALHHASRALPVGCGPTVGIAGLTLGGGLGLMGRRHGLTCDRLVGAQVVLADGRIVACDSMREPDLFWALRGAGGGQFGVVTSLVFDTVAEPHMTGFVLRWPEAAAADVTAKWQTWAPVAPTHLTADLRIYAQPGRGVEVVVSGAASCLPDPSFAWLDDLIRGIDSRPEQSHQVSSWRVLKSSLAGVEAPDLSGTVSRSEFFTDPLPARALDALLDELVSDPAPGRRELSFTAMGGAYSRVTPDETAFVHRDASFLLQHAAHPADPWLDRSWAIAHQFGTGGVYPNFPDPALEQPIDAYHGYNAARLRAIRQHYDPDRLFRFPQAV